MFWNLILWLSIIWIAPLYYVILANETRFKKNIVLGVTLPYDARDNKEVQDTLKTFRFWLAVLTVLLIGSAIVLMIVYRDNWSLTAWFIWLDLCILFPFLPYVLANQKLKQMKMENGWDQMKSSEIRISSSAATAAPWISPLCFIPAFLICVILWILDPGYWPLYLIMSLTCLLSGLGYRYLYRNKSEMVDENETLTQVLSRVRKQNWGHMWLLTAYSCAGYAFTFFLKDSPVLSLVLFCAITLFLLIAAVWIEFKVRHLQETLTKESGKDWYVDDDDKWIGGLIYYNPNDSRTMINQRTGINSSFNLATPAGKFLGGLIVVLVLSLPFWGLLINGIGSGDISSTLAEDTLTIQAGYVTYEIPTEEILEARLLDELPSGLVRTFGTGLPNFLEGSFSAPDYGKLTLCLDPTAPPFLLIRTEQKTFLFGFREAGVAEALLELLPK
ncbi:MAG: hypothetical protein IJ773_05285 [Lachnospiraceae bacterium]|nr:hypothetical protein [Lachnospiraceae bacterium]